MCLLRERLSCKQSKLRVNLILRRVDSLICTPKNSIATMALDHSRLGLENKSLETKSGRIFWVRQVYFAKSCQQVWGRVNQPFILFTASHLRWNSTMRRCFYHTNLGQNAVFHNFAIQIALIQYSGRPKHTWAFSETVNKISKIISTTSWFSFLTSAKVDCLN